MLYTLVIGIEFKKYKNPANISISVNNKFIDTFDLDKDYSTIDLKPTIERKWYESLDKSYWLDSSRWKKYWSYHHQPKIFKVYHIYEEHLYDNQSRKGIIEIKVKNSNSNFTNGFMTKSSCIKFSQLALFPTYMSKNKGEKLMKTVARVNGAMWKGRKKLSQRVRTQWPCCLSFTTIRENDTYEKNVVKDISTWIGGSFTAKISIKKKFKMLFFSSENAENKGFWCWATPHTLSITSAKPLLNIYDEDQRSNNA